MRLKMMLTLPVLLLLAVGAPAYSAEPNEQQAAISEIRKLDGWVKIDATSPQKPVVSVYFNYTKVTDAGLVHLKGLAKLEGLDLTGTKVTDEGVKKLQEALPDSPLTAGVDLLALPRASCGSPIGGCFRFQGAV
jgi:hypothetical protein